MVVALGVLWTSHCQRMEALLKKLATILTIGLALGTTPGLAQTPQAPATPGPAPAGLITTHATARRRLPNTVADASVSIEAHGRTVAAVQRTLAENSQTLLAFLRQAGTERLRTNAVNVLRIPTQSSR